MAKISRETLLENIRLQLQEIEMIQAMFPGYKEVIWHDHTLYLDAEEFLKSSGKALTDVRYLSFQVNLVAAMKKNEDIECRLKVSITLPNGYPNVRPEVSIISNELTRTEQSSLNQDLLVYISELECGQMLLLDIISWLQEISDRYYKECDHAHKDSKLQGVDTCTMFSFMWLYMHHIYSKEKRKDIIHWAAELCLTGFSLPGKPGVVYVEGATSNVDEYFERLRRLNWKRMTCKLKDTCDNRKFLNFQELCFDVHGGRDYHMDMGKFFIFLKGKDLAHMFKQLFGVDGQQSK